MCAVFQVAGTVFVQEQALDIVIIFFFFFKQASCLAHVLNTHGGMLSGPFAFLGFTC